MIIAKSWLKVIDNSGGVMVECIKVLKNARWADVGDEIVVAVQKTRAATAPSVGGSAASAAQSAANRVSKGDVRRAVIVRTKSPIRRPDGRFVRFDDNACVLLAKEGSPLGTRITGPVAAELRHKRWTKVVSLAPRVV
ncbi:mitochondrial ribosomal protein subunit L38 [Ramicandelaber brevisporus]|nr:mitochondrial ribosomal protein subunit L38 [Ramicandelaber brevisporus]